MKKKIILKDNIHDKEDIIETEIRRRDHLEIQIKNPSKKFKPKKGKGSFKRKPKYKNFENN